MKLDALGILRGKSSSPPTRRRGLKREYYDNDISKAVVASHAEAWIETELAFGVDENGNGRLPRGGVD